MEKNSFKKDNKPPQFRFSIYWIYGLILAGLVGLSVFNSKESVKQVSLTEFEQYVKNGWVKNIVVETNKDIAEAYIQDSALDLSLIHISEPTRPY
jgi:cell division protease FtsH